MMTSNSRSLLHVTHKEWVIGRANPPALAFLTLSRAIMERQASVHGQFGQVREFALMVEELKRLRAQASSLGIIEGPSIELWKEAEGIINLATQDDEDREYSLLALRALRGPT
jgi:hypothetical protein